MKHISDEQIKHNCAALYQVLGVLDAPEEALDFVLALAQDAPFEHDVSDLLPYDKPIEMRALELVDDAEARGKVVTITQRPKQPLAMGHAETVVEVRHKRS